MHTRAQPQPQTKVCRVQRAACHTGGQTHRRSCRSSSCPRCALCGHTNERSARSARTWAGPTLPKARGRPRPLGGVGRARAGLGRELPARTGEPTGHTRRRATPSSAPRPPGRSRRGLEAPRSGAGRQAGRDGAARGRLARESGLGRPIDLRCAGGWAATEPCVGAGAEGWGWEGCGRPTERDARDHTLSRRRRKRPHADLAAHASGLPVHSCCSARVTCTAGRSPYPTPPGARARPYPPTPPPPNPTPPPARARFRGYSEPINYGTALLYLGKANLTDVLCNGPSDIVRLRTLGRSNCYTDCSRPRAAIQHTTVSTIQRTT